MDIKKGSIAEEYKVKLSPYDRIIKINDIDISKFNQVEFASEKFFEQKEIKLQIIPRGFIIT